MKNNSYRVRAVLMMVVLTAFLPVAAQSFRGDTIPVELEQMFQRGLRFLAEGQNGIGGWNDHYGAQPGVVGIAVLAFLSHGENANHGPYRQTIRKGLEYILQQQDEQSGMIGQTMYNHGFATLALAEAYGEVRIPKLGTALQRAVDLILRSQAQNPKGGWRYQAFSNDADTTISGAQMVALFAARNAGIHVPDAAIERGLAFFASCMDQNGGVGYTNKGGPNQTRTAIASLAYSLNKDRETLPAKNSFAWLQRGGEESTGYIYYHMYYMAQALFHGDMREWQTWNRRAIALFRASQQPDGSWSSRHGTTMGTGSALLAMALNYRLMPIYER